MAIQKITGDVIATSAVTADSLADTTITAAKLHTTLDLTGKTVTVATASAGDNDTTVASTAFVSTAVANLADSAPSTLDTLNELAAALGDDANFSTTVTTSIATKLPLAGGTMTGAVNFSNTGENIHSPSAGILAIESRGPIQLWGDSNNNGASTSAVLEVLRDSTYSGAAGKSTLTAYDNGDIAFYEDTGATAKFFWDASTERLGIGTTSPAKKLHISSGVNDTPTTFRIENTDTTIETNQEVNTIEFYSNDASSSGTGISGKIAQYAFNPGNQYGLLFSTYNVTESGLQERMRIDATGKVGIGNNNPAARLTIDNSIATTYSTTGYAAAPANSMLYLNNTNGGSNTASLINFRAGSGDGVIGFVEGGGTNDADFVIQTDGGSNGVERFRISNSGNVGIGTDSPTKRLQIESGSTDNDGLFLSHSDGTIYAKLAVKNPGVDNNTLLGAVSNNDLEIVTGDIERMRVQSNGNVLIDCTATSGAGISDGGFLFRTDTSGHRYMQISTGNTGDADVLYVYKKNGTGITGVGTLSTYGDGINLKGGNGLVSIGYGQSNFIEFLTSTGSGQPRIRPSATDTVDLGDTARRFKDLQLGGKIEFNKTNTSSGGDHDFIKMGYNGSWSNNAQGLASISVDDGSGIIGRYGVTYDGSKGRFVITDMYHGGYGLSGDVFWVRGNGEAHFAGGGGDALTIGDGESNYVTINNASTGDVSSGYNIKSGSTTTTSLYGNAGEGWTTLMSGGSLGFRVNQASAGFNPMNIDTSGRITMPYQPCFCVVNPSGVFPNSTTDPFGKTGNGGTGAYTLRMNVGSHFSASTGRFTAPVAGNYYFSFSAMFDGNGSAGFDFKANGTAVNGGEALDSSSDTYTQISGSILLALSANDYVTVVQRGRRIHQRYGSFAGFLVG